VTHRVVLVGPPGVGKSTVGAVLARELGMDFVDLDLVVAERGGATAADLLRARGEAAFRDLEADALDAVLDDDAEAVIATGGGTVESERARERLVNEPLVIELVASPATLLTRLDGGDRPLLVDPGALGELAARRGPLYSQVADATVDASGALDEVVGAIARLAVRA
jgi:shikimate kinase